MALTGIIYLALVVAGYYTSADSPQWLAVCYGGVISLGLSWLGFVLLMIVPKTASPKSFFKLVLGGMAARMLVALGLIVLGIAVLNLPSWRLVISCMLSYVVFITLEHVYALPVLKNKNVQS